MRYKSLFREILRPEQVDTSTTDIVVRIFFFLDEVVEEADKFKPTTTRTSALHLQFYSSISVWRGTEGGGVDAHRERDHKEDILACGNKREGAYGCCLDLIASQNTSESAKLTG